MARSKNKSKIADSLERRAGDFGEEVEALGRTAEKKIEELSGQSENPEAKRLYRSGKERVLGGVCGGVAEYAGIDPVIVRLLWILLAFMGGLGIVLYIIAWIVVPRNPAEKWN
ncbi:MAG: PspC domain-containing protein [Candidatus Diapherotrites archaeon]